MSHSLRADPSADDAARNGKLVPSSSPFTMTKRGPTLVCAGARAAAGVSGVLRGRPLSEWTVEPPGSTAGRTRERPRISSESA